MPYWGGAAVVSAALPPAPVQFVVEAVRGSVADSLSLNCSWQPDAPLRGPAAALSGALPRCASDAAPRLVWPATVAGAQDGSIPALRFTGAVASQQFVGTLLAPVSSALVASQPPPGPRACVAPLRCWLLRESGSTTTTVAGQLAAARTVPVIVVQAVVPRLHDVLQERLPRGAGSSLYVLSSRRDSPVLTAPAWRPAVPPSPSGYAAAWDDETLAAAAASLSAAADIVEGHLDVPLKFSATSATNFTLIAANASSSSGVALFTSSSNGSLPVAAHVEVSYRAGSRSLLPLALRPVLHGAAARVVVPAFCNSSCSGGQLLLTSRGAPTADLLTLLTLGAASDATTVTPAADAAAAAAAAARVASLGISLTVPYPPMPLSGTPNASVTTTTPMRMAFAPAGFEVAASSPPGRLLAVGSAVALNLFGPFRARPSGGTASSSASVTLASLGLTISASCVTSPGYNISDAALALLSDPQVAASVCLNASHPARSSCPWGAGDECQTCGEGALCPGGYQLVPLPGWWVPLPGGSPPSDLRRCAHPATERCPGGLSAAGLTACGRGYLQGSYGCASCAAGYFPSEEAAGACMPCPALSSVWDRLAPVAVLVGYLAAGVLPFLIIIVAMQLKHGGTVKAGLKRGLLFLQAVVIGLQILVQSSTSSPALPPVLAALYDRLQVLQFRGVTAHPACDASSPMASTTSYLVFTAVLLGVVCVLVVATRQVAPPRPLRSEGGDGTVSGSSAAKASRNEVGSATLTSNKLWAGGTRVLRTASKRLLGLDSQRPAGGSKSAAGAAAAAANPAPRGATYWLPRLLQLCVAVAFLLYGRTVEVAHEAVRCKDTPLTVLVYLRSSTADGSALAAAGIPLSLTTLRSCLLLQEGTAGSLTLANSLTCQAVEPYLGRLLPTRTLVATPSVVCGEGDHAAAAQLGLAMIGAYGLGLPLLAFLYLKLALRKLGGTKKPVRRAAPVLSSSSSSSTSKAAAPLQSEVEYTNAVAVADPSLRYFTGSSVRLGCVSFFIAEALALHGVTALQTYLVPATTKGTASLHLAGCVALAASLCLAVLIVRPHRDPVHRPIAAATYALTCLAFGLVYATSLYALASGGDEASLSSAASAVQGLGYAVFVGTLLLAVIIFIAFLVSMRGGAKAEAAVLATTAAASSSSSAAAASAVAASPAAAELLKLVASSSTPASPPPQLLLLSRHVKGAPAAKAPAASLEATAASSAAAMGALESKSAPQLTTNPLRGPALAAVPAASSTVASPSLQATGGRPKGGLTRMNSVAVMLGDHDEAAPALTAVISRAGVNAADEDTGARAVLRPMPSRQGLASDSSRGLNSRGSSARASVRVVAPTGGSAPRGRVRQSIRVPAAATGNSNWLRRSVRVAFEAFAVDALPPSSAATPRTEEQPQRNSWRASLRAGLPPWR